MRLRSGARVAIVGAGPSGLVAAKHALQAGFDVAVFEASDDLGGQWHTFDARNNVPRIGRVLIAQGRDASDVALSSTFGPNELDGFKVWCDEVQ